MGKSKSKILVIGDVMVDAYIYGKSKRNSPEAISIPVIIPEKKHFAIGGAGNVAANLKSMGADVAIIGVLGNDRSKDIFCDLADGIDISQLIISEKHTTTLKQRTFLDNKQIYRMDEEEILDDKFNNNIIDSFNQILKRFDVVILSDYNKGVLNSVTISHIINECKKFDIPIIVDPKKEDFYVYSDCTVVTPNLEEFKKASKINNCDENTLIDAAHRIISENNIKYIAITRSEDGILLVGENIKKNYVMEKVDDPDVTGAGDSVVAALSIIFSMTKDIKLSVDIANKVGNLVVQKIGTAVVSKNELDNLIN